MRLELLNSEGPILTVVKINKDNITYKLIDQYNVEIPITKEDLIYFIEGTIRITDSKNKIWHYPSEPEGMKSNSIEKIQEFLLK